MGGFGAYPVLGPYHRSELKKMTAHDYEDMLQVGGVIDQSQLN
jgi:hypothetical protein